MNLLSRNNGVPGMTEVRLPLPVPEFFHLSDAGIN